jgi:Flp pilus assembly protein TadG
MKTWISPNRRVAHREAGVVAVLVAIFLVVLFGFAALAIDMGRAFVVRNELQNAADAGALAGACGLAGTLIVNHAVSAWAAADTAAASAANAVVALNYANGKPLANAQIQTGYWNVTDTPASLQSTTITPGQYDKPAVKVTVSLSSGNNGGPLPLVLAPVLGISSVPVSATAVAVISAPGYANTGSLFPMGISQCLLKDPAYWNATTGKPATNSGGTPPELTIGNGPASDGCNTGQWTSFQFDVNDVPSVDSLIQNGNPTPLSIGSNTWIESGVKTSIYNHMTDYINLPAQVLMPVVADNYVASNYHGTAPIIAFVAFQIDSSNGGSAKDITGHFIGGLEASGTSGGSGAGTYYGAYMPPALAQ